MPCSAAELVDGDCFLGSVDFLDFPELGAYLNCSRRLSLHAVAAWDVRSWRMQSLEARIPGHVKWRPDPQLNGSQAACAAWRLARGCQLYENKRFKDAEDELRALLIILPGRPWAMCRLADTLYGRAVSLNADAAPSQPSSQSSTPRSAGEAWVDGRMDGDGDRDGDDGETEELPLPYSHSRHSPLSPAPRLGGAASLQSLSVSESSIAAPEPHTFNAAMARWQEEQEEPEEPEPVTEEQQVTTVTDEDVELEAAADEDVDPPDAVVADRMSTTASASSRTQQPPVPWTTWTPPLEVDEGPETQERDDESQNFKKDPILQN